MSTKRLIAFALLLIPTVVFSEQEITGGDCNVQIQGSNNEVDLSGCKQLTEAQKLQNDLESVLQDVRISLFRKDELMFPEIETFLANPTEDNWRRVVWVATGNLNHIRNAINKSFRYDASIANASQQAETMVRQANLDVNKRYFNTFRDLRSPWKSRAFIHNEIVTRKQMPSKEQVLTWMQQLKIHYVAIEQQLNGIITKLAMLDNGSIAPNKQVNKDASR